MIPILEIYEDKVAELQYQANMEESEAILEAGRQVFKQEFKTHLLLKVHIMSIKGRHKNMERRNARIRAESPAV